MARKPRRRARLLLALGLAAALAIALLAAGLFPQDSLRRLVERRLREALGPETRLGRLHVVPGSLRAEIEGLVLEGPTYRLEVDHARAEATLALLLSRRLSLESLEARGARLVLRPPDSPAARHAPADTLPEVWIERLWLTDAQIRYQDPEAGGDVVLDGVEADGAIGTGVLDLRVSEATWHRPRPLVLTPVRARLELSPDLRLRLESLEAASASSRLHAEGNVGSWQRPELDLRFGLSLDLAEAADLAASSRDLDGRLQLDGEVKGPPDAVQVHAALSGEGLRLDRWPVDRLTGEATLDGGPERRFESTASAAFLGGRLEARADGEGTVVAVTATMRGLRLERVPPAVRGGRPLNGIVDGHVEARGDLDRTLAVVARAQARGSAQRMAHTASVEAAGRWSPKAGTVDLGWKARSQSTALADASASPVRQASLSASGRATGSLPPVIHGQVEGTARVAAPAGQETVALRGEASAHGDDVRGTLFAQGPTSGQLSARIDAHGAHFDRLELEGRQIRLEALAPGASGQIDLTATVSGPFDRLTGQAAGTAADVAWRGVEVGGVQLEARLQEGAGQARLSVPAFRAEGEAHWTRDSRVEGRVSAREAPLAPLAPLLGGGVDGQVTGQVLFHGRLDRWRDVAVEAEVAGAELVRGETRVRLAGPATLRIAGGRGFVQGLRLETQGARLRAEGELPLTASGRFDLTAGVEGRLEELTLPSEWQVSGDLSGSAHVTGTRARPLVAGDAVVRELLVISPRPREPLAASRELRLRLEGDRLVVEDALLEVAAGEVRLSAELPWAGLFGDAGPARLEASWAALDVEALAAVAGRSSTVPLAGRLDGRLELTTPRLSDPRAARGTLATEPAVLQVGEVDLQVSPVRVDVAAGLATLQPARLSSAGSGLDLQGRLDLAGRTVDGSARGQLDLRALDPLLEGGAASGQANLDLTVGGPLQALQGQGTLGLEDGTLRVPDLPQALSAIRGRVHLSGRALQIEDASAELGGGTVTMAGSARLAGAGLDDVRVEGTARDVSLRYPRDFKSRVDADLRLTGRTGELLLAGQVRAERALYDKDVFLLKEALRSEDMPVAPPAAFWSTVSLDLEALTENPMLVRNNLARIAATGRLRIRGDLGAPAPYGRLDLRPGGEIYLQTRRFVVEAGSLTYQGTLDPTLAVRAKALLRDAATEEVEVTVTAQGSLVSPSLRLSSVPQYSEKEIASLVATGRRNFAVDNTAWVAGEHAALLLASPLERRLERSLVRLGLDDVDIAPELLARESDPSARFTFGKQLTPRMRLIYSMGLTDAEERYFEAQYRFRLGREITLKLVRSDEGVYNYGAGQRLRFGAPPGTRRRWTSERTTLAEVHFTGTPPVPEEQLRSWVHAQPGRVVTYWDLQDDAEALEGRLRDQGFLEALVTVGLEGEVASFAVRAGAHYRWRVAGLSPPPDLTGALRDSLSEEEAGARGRQRLLEAAHRRGHWRARVETRVETEGEERTLVFEVDPGPALADLQVTFPGAQALSSPALLEAAGGEGALLTEPEAARRRLENAYRQARFLEAQVGEPQVVETESGQLVSVVVPVREGREAVVARVEFVGATRDPDELGRLAQVPLGQPYDDLEAADAQERLRDDYLRAGYGGVRVHSRLLPAGTDLTLRFEVHEGAPSTVGPVSVTGLRRTRESLVRAQVDLEPGEPLDPRRLSVIERRLLDLGVFSRAVVTADDQEPAHIHIEVQEQGPYVVAYDLRFSPEDRTTGQVDGEVGNLLGLGLAAGARVRLGPSLREARGSLHLPSLGRGDLLAAVFESREDFRLVRELSGPPRLLVEPALPIVTDTEVQRGFELQRASHPREGWDLLYGYRFKRISSVSTLLRQDVAGVEFSVVHDRRDDALDPFRGHFLSLSVEGGAALLGSDFNFSRFFGQFFLVRPLGPALTWAQGFRLGLARGLDRQAVEEAELFGRSSELFRAGGANSLRGYANDSVGPRGRLTGVSPGGQALIVLNQELRYRLPFDLGVAAFYDGGNVFATIDDLSLTLRHSVGVGVRWASPAGLLRFDVGFPLARRRGERPYQLFVSLGQAF